MFDVENIDDAKKALKYYRENEKAECQFDFSFYLRGFVVAHSQLAKLIDGEREKQDD